MSAIEWPFLAFFHFMPINPLRATGRKGGGEVIVIVLGALLGAIATTAGILFVPAAERSVMGGFALIFLVEAVFFALTEMAKAKR